MSKESLRNSLSGLDRQILELVAQRQSTVKKIGELKRDKGENTRDFAREKDVLNHARKLAGEVGLSADLAEELLAMLIRSSLTAQEQDRVAAEGQGSGRRALVIGGAGRMGAWFASFLRSQGFKVEIADPVLETGGWIDWHDAGLDQEIIVVATPLRTTAGILEELAQIKPGGLIFDLGSLKTPLRKPLTSLVQAGCRVTSVHPMFGPNTELLSGRHVVFVDVGCAEATREARSLFASTMAEQVVLGLDDHDRLIAYVLGLSHALNIAFITALAESGEAAPELIKMSSTTFDSQFNIAASLSEENPHLYFEIQHLNEYGEEALAALESAVVRIIGLVRGGHEEDFVELMRSGRRYVHDRQERAGEGRR
ncbi:MAG: prephenate dehydrogenase/arogenate dehydrogenase family protein [Gammaproteobacteria bacterium]|nr:prephenate dehydrogenase/arogenate dehydrogenase family protein [Gammaproteobacteria bacterium]